MITSTNLDRAQRAVVFIVGIVIIVLGLNVDFGGIATLGWQGPTDFVAAVNPQAYAVQDNHVRFLGGFWLGAGLIFMAGGLALPKLRSVLIALCAMIFVGGLARLSAADTSLLLSADILPSLALELLAFPLLGYWLSRGRTV